MSLRAAIDIGTNTMLLLIAEVADEKPGTPAAKIGAKHTIVRTLHDEIEFVRLGEGVHRDRRFSEAAMERARLCFQKFKATCDGYEVKDIRAVATSASRDSSNSKEFFDRIQMETGIRVEIIPGEMEARMSFLGGLLPGFDPQKTALLDIGGGSTEFVAWDDKAGRVYGQSLDMGCVRAREMFLAAAGDPYSLKAVDQMEAHLKELWNGIDSELQKELRQKEWIGIAGTPTTLAAHALGLPVFHGDKVDFYRLNRCDVGDLYEALASETEAQRESIPVVGKGRGDIIVPGAAILLTAMEFFGKEDIVVSSRGLRHGILLF